MAVLLLCVLGEVNIIGRIVELEELFATPNSHYAYSKFYNYNCDSPYSIFYDSNSCYSKFYDSDFDFDSSCLKFYSSDSRKPKKMTPTPF